MSPSAGDPGEIERQALQDFRGGRLAAAAEGFRSAREVFLQSDDPVRAAQAANSLCVTLLQAKQPSAALEAVEGTRDVFRQAGDELHWAEATGNWAAALEAVGRLDRAEALYREASDAFQELRLAEAEAHTRRALAALLLRQGRPSEATAAMQRALEIDPSAGRRGRWLRRLLGALSRRGGR